MADPRPTPNSLDVGPGWTRSAESSHSHTLSRLSSVGAPQCGHCPIHIPPRTSLHAALDWHRDNRWRSLTLRPIHAHNTAFPQLRSDMKPKSRLRLGPGESAAMFVPCEGMCAAPWPVYTLPSFCLSMIQWMAEPESIHAHNTAHPQLRSDMKQKSRLRLGPGESAAMVLPCEGRTTL